MRHKYNTMFNNSKYTNTYYKIINRALARAQEGYSESHHIIPRSLGGSNKKDNIVLLTAREHYICHLLLTQMVEGDAKKKMTYAAWTMARTRKIKTNSRIYARLKEQATENLRKSQLGVKRGPMSEEHKQKIREATLRRYQNPEEREKTGKSIKGREVSQETREKLSKARKGKSHPPTYGMKGKKHSPETLEKMRLARIRSNL